MREMQFSVSGLVDQPDRRQSLGVGMHRAHPATVILVQCKRNAPEHPVGRPAIQQFKGVIEENGADLGVCVTSSGFTAQARESARKNDRWRWRSGCSCRGWW